MTRRDNEVLARPRARIKRMGSPAHRRSMARFHEAERIVTRGLYWAALVLALSAGTYVAGAYSIATGPALCGTDTECAALCPAGDAGADCRANILD